MAFPGDTALHVAFVAGASRWQHHSPMGHDRAARRALDVCSGSTSYSFPRCLSHARQLPVERAANHETAALRSEIVAGDGASGLAAPRTRTSARGAGVDQPEGP